MMKKKLIIFGVGSLAKMMNFYFSRDSDYEVVAFTIDSKYKTKSKFLDKEIIEFERIQDKYPPQKFEMFIAIGPSKMNTIREIKYTEAKAKGYELVSYISPYAICNTQIGENNFIGDMSVINSYVEFGNNNLVWEHSVISNDSIIKDNCYISPNTSIGTNSIIYSNSIIGTGAIIKTGVKVSEQTLVGAGCYISLNTEAKGIYGQKSAKIYGLISDKINISL